ncbi:MAG: amidase, partial [Gemmatimonadetes bacterium]|nr:amidase [Gemmatimonadota bacterium]NIR81333.1 amidase [Gemmatimonadota bacterium]NIT90171.1 amidase [Gemmatimonadota bacterium]NIU33998.1 amidase [Gemmatimonadota bacterium]NIU38164.1 amidase [Gemmatimonadota bacterium]
TARFIPAVEYLQANRVRTLLGREMQETMRDLDVYVAPSGHDPNGLLTNLTGHPAVVVPTGFDEEGSPTSVVFVAGVDDEAAALAVAKAFQDATDYHTRQPPGFGVGEGRGAGD